MSPRVETIGEPLRVLSLFAGIGGFDLGLERTGGFKTAAFCEIDPFCRRVLAKHWPDIPCYEDVRALTAERLAADGIGVDVICGGFPCQDVSIAGARAGIEGEQSGLWRDFGRLVREILPRLVVVENTPGLLDTGMGVVLGDLAAFGYDAIWHCIPASAVGANHHRDRVWIIAHASQERWPVRADGNRQHASEVLSDINRFLALSLQRRGEQQLDADSLACLGARIPHGREERITYLGSALRRGDDGLPRELDAIGALGNAVVPQIPELIGRAILASLQAQRLESAA